MYKEERHLIIEVCKMMQNLGYFLGTWGNISIRKGEHILLTPSRIDYDSMSPEDIVIINLEGDIVEGSQIPTSEKEVHRRIYLVREDIGAIIHAHTPKAMAVSTLDICEIPCIMEEMSQLLGGSIPLTLKYIPAKEHECLGLGAAEVIHDKNGLILRNHGPVACGRCMEEAILVLKVIEKASQIFIDIRSEENIKKIPDEYVKSERERFLFSYGKEKT